ncbi:uncharacterized protein L969DRAFT_91476 [Mixia osmundae IAM 14324]|uniref:Glutamate pyruvate transaminase n=1 Tax=Mixia osmundae (strain CBS 9802 / IAM 14324 / JCM 22182 / KY 12970) TaxID=764103 RepID=G7E404_MIXOS|nr:uncharacterized protein L969DRAFT_91476 [Mixia osmundae IAM 14324]KEI42010.1 hypothetical protein L969DRAFT_91476 [Mixia osmundae IAM 14324]GAA97564.1 hypothetical protein E5Q_04242 [Mixia osmundae IAM 14324]
MQRSTQRGLLPEQEAANSIPPVSPCTKLSQTCHQPNALSQLAVKALNRAITPAFRGPLLQRSIAMSSVLQATTVSVEAATNYARSKVQGERKPDERVLTLDSINHNVKTAEYAVRGAIALRAEELRVKTQKGDTKDLNFKEVVSCNIGNPQQLGQTPITFFRQVAALCECPDLLDNPLAPKLFAQDAIDRAREYIKAIGSVGAYSHSKGVPLIRQYVADFLEERDGHKADPEKIYLTAGASAGVSNIMQLMIASPNDGVMIPIPQYPLYTAALALNNAQPIRYYLQEEKQWSPDVEGLKQVISEARASGILPKAICVISPGNPVGNVLSQEAIADILKFAYNERLVVLADEVYQTNIYHPSQKPFVSFRKVLRSLGEPYSSSVELVSFHSISKGQVGECGRRGGYFEIENFDPKVEEQIYKLASIQLCPPLQGQIAMGNLIRPPRKGDVSYDEYTKEVDDIQKTLAKRSDVLHKAFSELEGVDCQPAEGALYLFPQLKLPAKAQKAASEQGKSVDAMYCMDLLNETGICVVAGSGFGQEANTFHFRTTVLAPGTEDFVQRLKEFHNDFLHKYSD